MNCSIHFNYFKRQSSDETYNVITNGGLAGDWAGGDISDVICENLPYGPPEGSMSLTLGYARRLVRAYEIMSFYLTSTANSSVSPCALLIINTKYITNIFEQLV